MKILAAIMFSLITLAAVAPAHALDLATKTSTQLKIDRDVADSFKTNVDKKLTVSAKKSKSLSSGKERKTDDSEKKSGSQGKSWALDLTISPDVFFLKRLGELEQSGVQPFAGCQVVTHPRLATDFGMSADMGGGWINTSKLDVLSKAASNNMPVSYVGADEAGIKAYRDCLAVYGSVIREAFIVLQGDVSSLEGGLHKSKEGEIQVQGMGLDDYRLIAISALNRAVKTAKREKYDYLLSASPCRFEGRIEAVQCDSVRLTLGTKPELQATGITIYGSQYGGLSGSYKISSNWSLSNALDQLKSVSKFSKFAKEMATSADRAESDGETTDATYTRKKTLEQAQNADQSLSLSPLIKH